MEATQYRFDHLQTELGKRNLIILEKQGEVIELRQLLENMIEEFRDDLKLCYGGPHLYRPYRAALEAAEKYLNPATCNTP